MPFRRSIICLGCVLWSLLGIAPTVAQEVIPLWEKGAPGFEHLRDQPEQAESYWVKNIQNPSITAFLPPPEKATGAAVLVIPGGGHRELVFGAEGVEPAEYLNSLGVAAFVLKYRLCREEGSPYDLQVHPRQDARRAMRVIRSRADQWGIQRDRIGMLGFSAGGEVVSMATYSGSHDPPPLEPTLDTVDPEPSFVMIIYPGPLGIPKWVPAEAPPAFLLVSDDDWSHAGCVTDLLDAYRRAGAPVEAHIYARGEHGYNMGTRSQLASIKHWPERMADWMADLFLLNPSGGEAYFAHRRQQREAYEAQRQRRIERQRARRIAEQERSAPKEPSPQTTQTE